jgi:hypothetical protein
LNPAACAKPRFLERFQDTIEGKARGYCRSKTKPINHREADVQPAPQIGDPCALPRSIKVPASRINPTGIQPKINRRDELLPATGSTSSNCIKRKSMFVCLESHARSVR